MQASSDCARAGREEGIAFAEHGLAQAWPRRLVEIAHDRRNMLAPELIHENKLADADIRIVESLPQGINGGEAHIHALKPRVPIGERMLAEDPAQEVDDGLLVSTGPPFAQWHQIRPCEAGQTVL